MVALAATQLIGWATTFNAPAILGPAIARDYGIPVWVAFSGASVFLIAMALASLWMGRLYARVGAARIMALGSLGCSASLAVLAVTASAPVYLAVWFLIGVAGAAILSTSAYTLLVEISGSRAKRSISAIMLISGLAASIGFPVTAFLLGAFGWRGTVWIFAALHLLVAAPLHGLLGRLYPFRGAAIKTVTKTRAEGDRKTLNLSVFIWLAVSVSLIGLVTWGFAIVIVELLQARQLTYEQAVFYGAMIGVFQVAARVFEFMFASWVKASRSALFAAGLMSAACLIAVGFSGPVAMAVFVAFYGFASGVMSVARATMPLELFDAAAYGTIMSKLSLPMYIAFAAAPALFGFMLTRTGAPSVALAAALLSLLAAVCLWRLTLAARHTVAQAEASA